MPARCLCRCTSFEGQVLQCYNPATSDNASLFRTPKRSGFLGSDPDICMVMPNLLSTLMPPQLLDFSHAVRNK